MEPTAPPASNPHFEDKFPIPPQTVEPSTAPPHHVVSDLPPSKPPQELEQQGIPAYPQIQPPQAIASPYPQTGYPIPQQQIAFAESPQQQYPLAVQQPGYPPQGYPPQQTSYPAQGYPQQQQNLTQGAPPPYYSQVQSALPPQQELQTNVVVVAQQPSHAVAPTAGYQPNSTVSNAVVFSILVTILFTMCFCWWTLTCLIPAIVFGYNARSSGYDGNEQAAKRNANISYGLSAGAIISVVVAGVVCFGAFYGSIVIR